MSIVMLKMVKLDSMMWLVIDEKNIIQILFDMGDHSPQ